jgi:N-hydroxyarylamine O-acetyltransferase
MDELMRRYVDRIGVTGALEPTIECLRGLHRAHFYSVPFENFDMHETARHGLTAEVLHEKITIARRGGICFETGALMRALLDECGFEYHMSLGSMIGANRTPATHQVFIVEIDEQRWLFDIGFGARGPRGVLPLVDGGEVADEALSARVTAETLPGSTRWTVSVLEHATGSTTWEPAYSFIDAPVGDIDIDMSYFYTVHSPNSLLNRHRVASRPTPAGRVSVRDDHLIVVENGHTETTRLASAQEIEGALLKYFDLEVS